MNTVLNDLRYGLRTLRKAPGFTLTALVTLALGIGANTTIFTAVNGLLLRTLPVDHPETLVRFQTLGRNEMGTDVDEYERPGADGATATFSTYAFQQFRAANQTLVALFACAPERQQNVVVDGQAELATGFVATGNYHQMLGVRAIVGRTLTPDDDREDGPQVAVLSYGYWMRRFGGDPNVLGKVLYVNTVPVTVVGVTARDFIGVQQLVTEPSDVTMPLRLDRQFNFNGPAGFLRFAQPTWAWLQVMGRLKPGVTAEQVQANLAGVYQQAARDGWAQFLASATPELRSLTGHQDRIKLPRLKVTSGARGIYEVSADTYRSITLLGVVVALVLAIVCANVANLLLSRAMARQREIAVRLSLGATRWRLVRQLLTESVLLSAIGGAAGLLVAYWGRQLLPDNLAAAAPDWRVFGFVGGLALATGVIFGIAPAWRASFTKHGVGLALKEGRGAIGGRSHLGKSLVVAQVASSLVLLIGAGLFLRTVDNLRRIDVGFDPNNLLLVTVNPGLNRYNTTRSESVYAALLERLPQMPGARAATLSSPTLLGAGASSTNLFIDDRSDARNRDSIYQLTVAPNFFETMGMRLVAGRGFTERDNRSSQRVTLINEAVARKYFPNENPIGRHIGSTYRNARRARDHRYRVGCEVPQHSRCRAAHDIRIVLAGTAARFQVDVRDPHGRRSAADRDGRPRGDPPRRSESRDHERHDAERSDRTAIRAGESVCPGLCALRRPGSPDCVGGAIRADVVQRRKADRRNWHPNGARRPPAGCRPHGDARIDRARRARRAHRHGRRARRRPVRREPPL